MAKKSEHSVTFEAPFDKVVAVLASEQFQIDREVAQGALSASVKFKSQTPDKVVYEVYTVEYAKGITGIDRSKTETATATYDWDLKSGKCFWTYVPGNSFADRVKVSGSIKATANGDRTALWSDFNIEIRVPLVGGKFEGMVIAEVEKGWSIHDDVLRKHLAR